MEFTAKNAYFTGVKLDFTFILVFLCANSLHFFIAKTAS